jgi:hypothetical protein
LGEGTHSDGGEIVDGEPDVAGIVVRENALEARLEGLVGHPSLQFGHAHILRDILDQNFDEDTTSGCRLLLIQMNDGQHVPADGVTRK